MGAQAKHHFQQPETHAQEVNLGLPVSAAEPQQYLPAVPQQLPGRRQEKSCQQTLPRSSSPHFLLINYQVVSTKTIFASKG
jgi:hypothetical protein